MTFPHPAQGSPSDSLIHPEVDGDVGITEPFGPPPAADEVFPAAMFAAAVAEAGSNADVMASLPPGHPSGPTPVVAGDAAAMVPPPPPPPPEPSRRRRKAPFLVTVAVVALAGTGGVATYAAVHKTVTLDVDGEVTTVETFQSDVAGLLADEGVEVAGRDAVSPGLDGVLREGDSVVVRYSHKVTVRADGELRTVQVIALDADEALATLAEEAPDAVLVPSRAEGYPTLPMRLDTDGPVRLLVGGEVQQVADGSLALDELLAENGVTVDGDDRIFVRRMQVDDPGTPALTVVVRDVQVSIIETAKRLPFDTVTATDPGHYKDQGPYVATEGAVGRRVTSWDVTKVDGKVVEKEKLNSWVELAPVDKVIMYGTKERPQPKPEPTSKSDSKSERKSDSKSGSKSDSKSDSKSETKRDREPDPEAKSDATSDGKEAEREP